MFRIDQLRKDNLDTIINIGDVTKIVVEEVREHLEAGIYTRSITIFTENGDSYSLTLEGAEKGLAFKDPEPDEVRLT